MSAVLTIVLALLAAGTNAAASVMQRIANRREALSGVRGTQAFVSLLREPVWLLGIGAVILSFAFQAAALSIGELAQVQPLMALELPITLLLAARVFSRRPRRTTWIAIVAIAAGMSLLLFALQPTGGHPDQVPVRGWIFGAGGTAALVVVLVLVSRVVRPTRRAALLGVAAGSCFALTALFMAAALTHGLSWSILSRWQTYLVVVAGLSAMFLLQWGMQSGTLVAVQPGLTLADPAVSVVLGVLLFAENVRTGGWIFVEVFAAAIVGWATVELARSDIASAEAGD